MANIAEALATMHRARDEAVAQIATGNPGYAAQLEEAHKAIQVLLEIQRLES
jgi:hypothetical protein